MISKHSYRRWLSPLPAFWRQYFKESCLKQPNQQAPLIKRELQLYQIQLPYPWQALPAASASTKLLVINITRQVTLLMHFTAGREGKLSKVQVLWDLQGVTLESQVTLDAEFYIKRRPTILYGVIYEPFPLIASLVSCRESSGHTGSKT